ncbi:hypothetical protein H9Q72_012282 [Fusarium xylarioides]|uniref:Major facilitator superfamily (MFS) profile domain-containing protein n=1 Tax=Fusarium xylarioides TaxID=221167 RepID=A0A9P7HH99_9HYPO|nr:hypothetical protein H9Q72_012282 [Fusarium xylarioides]
MAVTNVLEDSFERKSLEKSSHQPSDFARGQCIPTGEIVPLSWDEKEETAIRKRLDLTVIPIVTFLYLLCFIDRIFYIAYLLVEVPSNILMKRYGPHIIIPTLVIGFGFVSICTAFVKSFAGLATARAVLGIFEGGTMPGVFVAASALAGAFGGLLASALTYVLFSVGLEIRGIAISLPFFIAAMLYALVAVLLFAGISV